MIILNVIVLCLVAFGLGYCVGKGKVEFKWIANKKMSKEILANEKQQLQDAIQQYNEALESYNEFAKNL